MERLLSSRSGGATADSWPGSADHTILWSSWVTIGDRLRASGYRDLALHAYRGALAFERGRAPGGFYASLALLEHSCGNREVATTALGKALLSQSLPFRDLARLKPLYQSLYAGRPMW